MKRTVLNFKHVDRRKEPMFFGAPLGLQRYDQLKYPIFFRLARNMEQFIWFPQVISLAKDRLDYERMGRTERHVFDSNLRWQTATDALLNRSILEQQQYVSLPEIEAAMSIWAMVESNIHSRSYSWILQNVYPSETVFWDSIEGSAEIASRMQTIVDGYDALFESGNDHIRQNLFNSVVQTNVVESVRFYVSFVCSLYFSAHGKMEGSGKIIQLIKRDEDQHVAVTTNMLKYMRTRPDEGFMEMYQQNVAQIVECFFVTAQEEKAWIDYLFSEGPLTGLNAELMKQYVEYQTNKRLKIMELPPIYREYRRNPLGGWFKQYEAGSNLQVAPQETELSSYVLGGLVGPIQYEPLKQRLALVRPM